MKKLFFSFLFLLTLLVLVPNKTLAASGKVDFNTSPSGPLNPGDKYTVNIKVYSDDQRSEICQGCKVMIRFVDNDGVGQPGDEVISEAAVTDNLGQLKAAVTSYTYIPDVNGREIYAIVTFPNGENYSSSPYNLEYRNVPILGFIRLVTKVVSRGFKLPPMGNISPHISKQLYLGDGIRQVYLEMDKPFGTKSYIIYAYPQNEDSSYRTESWYKQHIIKIISDNETDIRVNAFEDLDVEVLGCSEKQPNLSLPVGVLPCVGPDLLHLPKLENPQIATPSAENSTQDQNNFTSLPDGPLKSFLEGIYSKF